LSQDNLRKLAEKLGYFQTRGVGTGQVGSVSAFLVGLAWTAAYDPGGTEKVLRERFADVGTLPGTPEEKRPPEMRRDANTDAE
jgi:hypothetical protein